MRFHISGSISRGLLLLACVATAPAALDAQLVGTGSVGNVFPFGGPFSGAGTVYQQVYSSSLLTGGVLQSVSFFRSDEDSFRRFRPTSISLYVSTTARAVNGLNTTDFDANRGTDNVLFGTYTLDDLAPPPATLTFAGTGFNYDPLAGNLLLDFRFSASGPTPFVRVTYKSDLQTSAGAFSRATDFGITSDNTGLQTEFAWALPVAVPEPSTLALLISSLCVLCLVARRRRGASH